MNKEYDEVTKEIDTELEKWKIRNAETGERLKIPNFCFYCGKDLPGRKRFCTDEEKTKYTVIDKKKYHELTNKEKDILLISFNKHIERNKKELIAKFGWLEPKGKI